MVTRLLSLLATLAACTAIPTSTSTSSVVGPVTIISGPTEQDLVLPVGFDHGEINQVSITGEAVCYPADTFAHAERVLVTDNCSGHSQRIGGLSIEVGVTPGADNHDRNVVAMQCSAHDGATNNCLQARFGDVVLDHGDLYTNEGHVAAASYVSAGTKLLSFGGAVALRHASGWGEIRAYAAPPDDYAPPGTLAIDASTPALWISTGSSWLRMAEVP